MLYRQNAKFVSKGSKSCTVRALLIIQLFSGRIKNEINKKEKKVKKMQKK